MDNLPLPHPRHVASKEEISIGKSIILGLEMDIKGLKKQIADLQSRVAYLESKKANYASYIAPLRCLPADILNIIVEFCIHGGIGLTTLMQICGVFRDVVIGMKSIWGNILLMGTGRCHNKIMDFSNSLERGIGCATAEQLALVLSRAEFNPINLYIELPVMDCDVKLSYLQSFSLQSLTILYPSRYGQLQEFTHSAQFTQFDLSSVKDLEFIALGPGIVEEILSSFPETSQEDLTLTFRTYHTDQLHRVLQHRLIWRVTKLNIISKFDHEVPTSTTPVQLPRVVSCDMELNPRLLDCLEFKVIESLRFHTRAPTGPIRPASIPYTLTRLVLLRVKLIPEHSAGAEPHHLPNLSNLEIDQGDIVGELAQYFVTPKLRTLKLSTMTFRLDSSGAPAPPGSRKLQSVSPGNAPELEVLSLDYVVLGGRLFSFLQRCHLLQELSIERCYDLNFLGRFIDYLQSEDSFTSLKNFHIDSIWTERLGFTFGAFLTQCEATRPHMKVLGNGDLFWRDSWWARRIIRSDYDEDDGM